MELKDILEALETTKAKFKAEAKAEASAEIKAALDAKSAEIDAKIAQIKGLPEGIDLAKMKEDLAATIKGFAEFQVALQNGNQGATVKSWQEQLIENVKSHPDYAKALQEKSLAAPIRIDLKSVITIGEGTTIGSGTTQNTLTQNTGIISPLRKRALTYLQNVSVGSVGNKYALWIEETDEQGTPIFIAEAATKTKISVKYVEKTAEVKKIAVHGKVTTEFLADLPQLVSYVQNNLMKRVDLKTEDLLFTGNGTGDNIAGLSTFATAFTGSTMAGTVKLPNNFDVLAAAILQVKKAFGTPTGFFVNEGYLAQMVATKTQYGEYVQPTNFIGTDSQGFTTLMGVRLIGTNALDSLGIDFIGGDLSVVNVAFREGMTVQIGTDGNDFTENLKTILVEQRLVQFVSANDTQCLVKGTFAAAKALLEEAAIPEA